MATRGIPTIFSDKRRTARAERAAARQRHGRDPAAWYAQALSDEVLERARFMRLEPERVLIGGAATSELVTAFGDRPVEVEAGAAIDRAEPIPGAPYELAISLGQLDTVNDLPGALLHIRAAMAEGGIALLAMPGAGSLPVLRAAMLAADGERPAARIHPQVDRAAASALMERAGFRRQVVDGFPLRLRYASLARLAGDLRDQGLTSALASVAPPLTRAGRNRARAAFAEAADEDGRVTEIVELLVMTGWA